jgi:hypothetical protein
MDPLEFEEVNDKVRAMTLTQRTYLLGYLVGMMSRMSPEVLKLAVADARRQP